MKEKEERRRKKTTTMRLQSCYSLTDDHSRVVLRDNGADDDYINANFIHVRSFPFHFVCLFFFCIVSSLIVLYCIFSEILICSLSHCIQLYGSVLYFIFVLLCFVCYLFVSH